jgi:hypothetical protein
MKQSAKSVWFAILFAVALIGIQLTTHAQTPCDGGKFTTIGAHYIWADQQQGAGVEIAINGNESNWSLTWNADVLKNTSATIKENESDISGRVYMKPGYRVLRIPYKLSVYTDVMGGLSLDNGFYYGAGIKILVPLNRKALSIEPMYVDKQFNLQFALHFVV